MATSVEFTALLRSQLKTFPEIALQLSDGQIEKLAEYAELLERWTDRVDLVAKATPEMLVSRHFVDSVVAWLTIKQNIPLLQPDPVAVLDVGSGAGFPGAVIAILEPENPIFLCEPREKRSLFLQEIRRSLALKNVTVLTSRIEELKDQGPGSIGIVVTRATGMRDALLAESTRLVPLGGIVVELSVETSAEDAPGWSFERVLNYELPPDSAKRSLLCWRHT